MGFLENFYLQFPIRNCVASGHAFVSLCKPPHFLALLPTHLSRNRQSSIPSSPISGCHRTGLIDQCISPSYVLHVGYIFGKSPKKTRHEGGIPSEDNKYFFVALFFYHPRYYKSCEKTCQYNEKNTTISFISA